MSLVLAFAILIQCSLQLLTLDLQQLSLGNSYLISSTPSQHQNPSNARLSTAHQTTALLYIERYHYLRSLKVQLVQERNASYAYTRLSRSSHLLCADSVHRRQHPNNFSILFLDRDKIRAFMKGQVVTLFGNLWIVIYSWEE